MRAAGAAGGPAAGWRGQQPAGAQGARACVPSICEQLRAPAVQPARADRACCMLRVRPPSAGALAGLLLAALAASATASGLVAWWRRGGACAADDDELHHDLRRAQDSVVVAKRKVSGASPHGCSAALECMHASTSACFAAASMPACTAAPTRAALPQPHLHLHTRPVCCSPLGAACCSRRHS